MFETYKKRESGIELLKVICIFLIILSHIVQTLGKDYYAGVPVYIYDFSVASTNPISLTLALMRHLGHVGTSIFFICSAWFMVKMDAWNNKKIVRLWVEVFFFSMIFLAFMAISNRLQYVETSDLFKAIFPVFTAANWYISIYIAFALFVPLLNRLLKKLDLRITLISAIVLLIVGYVFPRAVAQIPSFLGCYLFIYYLRNKNESLCDKTWFNLTLIFVSLILFVLTFVALNIYGLKTDEPKVNILWQVYYGNALYYFFGFGVFNLFRKLKFKSGFINYVSTTALVCYVVHENIFLRLYIRPLIWNMMYTEFSHELIVLQSVVFAVALFIFSFLIAVIYKSFLQKWIYKFADLISSLIRKLTSKITRKKLQAN